MGETSDDSSVDRIHSWAKAHASNRTASLNEYPLRSPPAYHAASTSTGSTASQAAWPSSRPVDRSHDDDVGTGDRVADNTSSIPPPPAPPPHGNTSDARETVATVENEKPDKPKLTTRLYNGTLRFGTHTKDAVFYSKINLLLVFVPLGIAVNFAGLDPQIIFAMNAIAVVPLAGLLSHATESVASRLGDTIGALLNVTFGNAVELIIFIALAKNEIRIVQASLIGSILANLLLILGMAFLLGGLRFREQIYNSTVTQMSACLLSLSVMSLLLPTAFHASFKKVPEADHYTMKVSRGTSVILLFVYFLYLLFQLKSHAHLYQSMPQHMIDEESHPGVLADIMGSSSSSSSSDDSTSSSDTDTTSGSHHTASRIKKAFRNRRRRKSSASSKDTSIPSTINSPAGDVMQHQWADGTSSTIANGPREPNRRRGSALNAILSGDEADTDGEHEGNQHVPRVRDFEGAAGEGSKSPERKCKKKYKHKNPKHQRKQGSKPGSLLESEKDRPAAHTMTGCGNGDNSGTWNDMEKVQPVPAVVVQDDPGRHVDFAEETVNPLAQDVSGTKRSFMRQFPTRPSLRSNRASFRPPLPSLLSNNVFLTPGGPTSSAIGQGGGPMAIDHSLRRANSLPGRLNEKAVSAQPGPRPPIPPYSRQTNQTPQSGDEDVEVEKPLMSRTAAVVLLLASTALVAVCAEFLVGAIPEMTESSAVSQAFIGLIILPVVGNAAEHVTAVTVATKNKMDLAIGVAVGSSIQIALFVTPLVVILGWAMGREMSLYFNLFETISLFVTAFVVNFLVLDGRSNYLEGALLIASYVIIAVGAFFYPDEGQQSQIGGSVGE